MTAFIYKKCGSRSKVVEPFFPTHRHGRTLEQQWLFSSSWPPIAEHPPLPHTARGCHLMESVSNLRVGSVGNKSLFEKKITAMIHHPHKSKSWHIRLDFKAPAWHLVWCLVLPSYRKEWLLHPVRYHYTYKSSCDFRDLSSQEGRGKRDQATLNTYHLFTIEKENTLVCRSAALGDPHILYYEPHTSPSYSNTPYSISAVDRASKEAVLALEKDAICRPG